MTATVLVVVGALTDVASVVAAEEGVVEVVGGGFDPRWRSCHAPVVATIPVRVIAAMVVRNMSGAGGGEELVDDRDRKARDQCADDAAEDPVLAGHGVPGVAPLRPRPGTAAVDDRTDRQGQGEVHAPLQKVGEQIGAGEVFRWGDRVDLTRTDDRTAVGFMGSADIEGLLQAFERVEDFSTALIRRPVSSASESKFLCRIR